MTRTFDLLADGLAFPESARWHDGALFLSEKRAGRVIRIDPEGRAQAVVDVPGEPSGLGWLPDGSLLVVSMGECRLLALDGDGLREVADLRPLVDSRLNDMVVDRVGRAYVGHFGDGGPGAQPGSASLVLVPPDGPPRIVAKDLQNPNGCVVMPDRRTLIVAESRARLLTAFAIGADGALSGRRVWAELGSIAPDGICLDAEGAIWVADPLNRQTVRVFEGGRVAARLSTGEQGPFSCVLGGADGRTLHACTYTIEATSDPAGPPIGCVLTARVDMPSGGSP